MKYSLAADARPQLKLLLIATVITIALWFLPYIGVVTYPIRLFVTFIHEGSHVLAAPGRDLVPVEEDRQRVSAAVVLTAEHAEEVEPGHAGTVRCHRPWTR